MSSTRHSGASFYNFQRTSLGIKEGIRTSATQASYVAPDIEPKSSSNFSLNSKKPPTYTASIKTQKDLPQGVTPIVLFGKTYTHFNMDDSMLDVQFVKTAKRIETVYLDVFSGK